MDEKIKYKGSLFALVEKKVQSGGKEFTIEVARRAPGIRLIIDPGDGTVVISKEYRHELKRHDIRLPGGKVFDTLDEYLAALERSADLGLSIEKAARREAHEEVGVLDGDFTWLAKSVCGVTVEWDLHFFAVTNPIFGKQAPEEGEEIEVLRVPKEEARAMCLDGTISEERSALQLLKYLS